MTSVVFKIAEGMACRGCGATLAPVHDNKYDLCRNCWTAVSLSCGSTAFGRPSRNHGINIKSVHVTRWLADKLALDVKRLNETGIVGRCEAISRWRYGVPGTQCANRATERRDGHVVCDRHAKATAPQYVGTETADPYVRFSDLLRELCLKDAKFSEMVTALVKSLDVSTAREPQQSNSSSGP